MSYPILYSLRRCPYCIRARLALLLAEQPVFLRDVVTRQLPEEMLAVSEKATVPVLVLQNGEVIDESLDIMLWALRQYDPYNLLLTGDFSQSEAMVAFIQQYDVEFVLALDRYKAAARYHDKQLQHYREACQYFINHLEERLTNNMFLWGDSPCLVDYALLPLLRQFSRVERQWYLNVPYPNLERWFKAHYENPLYSKSMKVFPRWLESKEDLLLINE